MKVYDVKKMVTLQAEEREFVSIGTYFEVPYTEYREDGSIYCKGTEDFSRERLKSLIDRTIYLPTGKKNKGGHMIWKSGKRIISNSTKEVRKLAKIFYPDKEFQIREY